MKVALSPLLMAPMSLSETLVSTCIDGEICCDEEQGRRLETGSDGLAHFDAAANDSAIDWRHNIRVAKIDFGGS